MFSKPFRDEVTRSCPAIAMQCLAYGITTSIQLYTYIYLGIHVRDTPCHKTVRMDRNTYVYMAYTIRISIAIRDSSIAAHRAGFAEARPAMGDPATQRPW